MYAKVTDKMHVKSRTITVADWVKKLRSGRYKQTEGRLCDGSAYCCLGVAARGFGVPLKAYDGNSQSFGYFPDEAVVGEGGSVVYLADDVLGDDFTESLANALRKSKKPISVNFPLDPATGFLETSLVLVDGKILVYYMTLSQPRDGVDDDEPDVILRGDWSARDLQGFFTELNDSIGLNFKQIADLVEAFFRPAAKLHLGWYTGKIEV